jgi:hypothetical protein
MADLPDFIPATLPTNAVSRQNPDADTATGLAPAYEVRVVVLGMGAHFVPDPTSSDFVINQLNQRGLTMANIGDNTYSYSNDSQQVTYILFLTADKSVFEQALATDNLIVAYAGHARHGMGPCFHVEDVPGDWWYDGTDATNGIYKMGYPYIAIPISDLVESQYHARPLTADQDKPPQDSTQLHPKLIQNYGALTQFNLADLDANPDNVTLLTSLLPDGPYWGLDCIADSGRLERHLVMNAGYDDLTNAPFACRVFLHLACSTFVHNYKVVRFLEGWKKDGDTKLAYWTTDPAPPIELAPIFLFHLFTCQLESGFGLWEPVFNYAVKKSNREIPAGFHYKVI